jgi:hydrogenase expression/formation protein HypD
MKYLSEYRNPELALQLLEDIKKTVSKPWTIMEVCGGQTHSLVKNGILNLLPDEISMVHGPGCPVCVTPIRQIDAAISLASRDNVILCSFGDMIRVPGSDKSLLEAKAEGADIRILLSPLEAVKLAKENPDKEIVFFAVGFETTAPANALSVAQAFALKLNNYSILTSHVLVPPAIMAVMDDDESQIDAFLAAGHVCTIMGTEEYFPLASKYNIPIVITGFEPVDLLRGILSAVEQLERKIAKVENVYERIVKEEGNEQAKKMIHEVFRIDDRAWRGIGVIPSSGYELRTKYAAYDASKKFDLSHIVSVENESCIAGEIMKGIKKPMDCPNFGTTCTPSNPLGAPMVSSEGSCAAYFNYQ